MLPLQRLELLLLRSKLSFLSVLQGGATRKELRCGITIGPVASNQPKPLGAGGVVGFMGGTLAAAGAVSVTYSHADLQPATLLLYVAGV